MYNIINVQQLDEHGRVKKMRTASLNFLLFDVAKAAQDSNVCFFVLRDHDTPSSPPTEFVTYTHPERHSINCSSDELALREDVEKYLEQNPRMDLL